MFLLILAHPGNPRQGSVKRLCVRACVRVINSVVCFHYYCHSTVLSVLLPCWLGGRKGIRPVKTERLGAGVVICLERGADLYRAIKRVCVCVQQHSGELVEYR